MKLFNWYRAILRKPLSSYGIKDIIGILIAYFILSQIGFAIGRLIRHFVF